MKVTLKEKYGKLACEYEKAFVKKFNIQDGFWVSDKVYDVFGWSYAGDFISYEDMRYIVDHNISTEVYENYTRYIYDNLKDMCEMPSIERWLKLMEDIKREELEPPFIITESVKLNLPF